MGSKVILHHCLSCIMFYFQLPYLYIQIYMKPLLELAQSSAPILDSDTVNKLFGPITDISHHHELFYSALLSRTLNWNTQQKIGDIFMSSVSLYR